jgi:Na+-translocating ferredoxin:NAD+ oxidoreductase subunit E
MNMSNVDYKQIALNGLWKNNPGLVQLLGLCPLLATSNSIINALGLGIATTVVLMASNATISGIRNIVPGDIRLPVFVLVIAAFVTIVDLLMHAFLYDLWKVLGIFIPLIVTNCIVFGRAESFASRNAVPAATLDGLMMGLGFSAVLVFLGTIRELLGSGTLFAGADLLLGPWASALTIEVLPNYRGMLIAVLPPGAFFGLGLLVAIKNIIDQRAEISRKQKAPAAAQTVAT